MTDRPASTPRRSEAGPYEIRLKGHLDAHWAAWFDGLKVCQEPGGTTVIRGPIADQAGVLGVLRRIGDLGLPLMSVVRVEHDKTVNPAPPANAGPNPLTTKES